MAAYTIYIVIALIIILVFSAFRVLREYQRGVIFMLGHFWKVKGPGLIIVVPVIQQMVRVDLRTIVMDVPTQDVLVKQHHFRVHRQGTGNSHALLLAAR